MRDITTIPRLGNERQHQPPKNSVYRSHVRHRRNDTSRLVREIKRRLHARSRPAVISSTSSSSSSPISSFFSSAPFSPFTRCAFPHQRLNRAILGRAANTSHADGEDVLRNRWPLSNIFLPASLVLTILRSDSLATYPRARARARGYPQIRARPRCLEPQPPAYRR